LSSPLCDEAGNFHESAVSLWVKFNFGEGSWERPVSSDAGTRLGRHLMKLQLDLHYGSQKTALPLSATPCSAPNAPLLNSLALSPSSCFPLWTLTTVPHGILMVSKYAEGRRHLTDVTHLPWTCTALHHPRDTTSVVAGAPSPPAYRQPAASTPGPGCSSDDTGPSTQLDSPPDDAPSFILIQQLGGPR
jgi:hypothetical protein